MRNLISKLLGLFFSDTSLQNLFYLTGLTSLFISSAVWLAKWLYLLTKKAQQSP